MNRTRRSRATRAILPALERSRVPSGAPVGRKEVVDGVVGAALGVPVLEVVKCAFEWVTFNELVLVVGKAVTDVGPGGQRRTFLEPRSIAMT